MWHFVFGGKVTVIYNRILGISLKHINSLVLGTKVLIFPAIYPWSLKVLDYPADKYHAQRDENRADCKTEDCP
ncbi:hypothetical protein AwEntero_31080 [Enterobacterales bacterium]|nr:hypothetical protein AwEntero_31080 [Enterobacterales bacterium]